MNKSTYLIAGGLSALGLALGASGVFHNLLSSSESQEERTASWRAAAIDACNAHVMQAELDAHAAIDSRAEEFKQFVDERKEGAGTFSKELASLTGKWIVVKSRLPGTNSEGHKKYVESKFNEHIFSPKQLAEQYHLILTEAAKDLEGIENKLAVKVLREIASGSVDKGGRHTPSGDFSAAIERVKKVAQWGPAKAGASLAASEIVSIVGTQVLVRLSVSAGILTTGAASGWWTLGTGIVVGLIVDTLWDRINDPAGDIKRVTLAELDQLANNSTKALRSELRKVVINRAQLWRAAVEETIPVER